MTDEVATFSLGDLDKVQAVTVQEFLIVLTHFFNAEFKTPWAIRESRNGKFVVTARIYGEQHE